jgi:Mannosyltransferase (PIG-V)
MNGHTREMSIGAAHSLTGRSVTARTTRVVASRLGVAVRGAPLPLRAFVGSRLVVLLAGMGGTLTLAQHAPAATSSAMLRQLGSVGYVLSGAADRFDSSYYLDIAAHGFGTVASGKIAFFPLYPLLIRAFTPLIGSPVLAGVVISMASFLGALVLLHRLTELELGRRAADVTVLLISFAPLSFFFSAVYTESLFLLLSVATTLAARQERWSWACGLGALATLTRPTGVLLVILLGVIHLRAGRRLDRRAVGLLVVPATLLAYLGLLALGGHSWMDPFRIEASWSRTTVGPILGLGAALWQGLRGLVLVAQGTGVYHPSFAGPFSAPAENLILLLELLAAGVALQWCRRRLPPQYFAYALVVLLSCLSSPVKGEPLLSVDRYILTTFPLFMAAGAVAARHRLQTPMVVFSAALLVFYTAQASSWAFVA